MFLLGMVARAASLKSRRNLLEAVSSVSSPLSSPCSAAVHHSTPPVVTPWWCSSQELWCASWHAPWLLPNHLLLHAGTAVLLSLLIQSWLMPDHLLPQRWHRCAALLGCPPSCNPAAKPACDATYVLQVLRQVAIPITLCSAPVAPGGKGHAGCDSPPENTTLPAAAPWPAALLCTTAVIPGCPNHGERP